MSKFIWYSWDPFKSRNEKSRAIPSGWHAHRTKIILSIWALLFFSAHTSGCCIRFQQLVSCYFPVVLSVRSLLPPSACHILSKSVAQPDQEARRFLPMAPEPWDERPATESAPASACQRHTKAGIRSQQKGKNSGMKPRSPLFCLLHLKATSPQSSKYPNQKARDLTGQHSQY